MSYELRKRAKRGKKRQIQRVCVKTIEKINNYPFISSNLIKFNFIFGWELST